jgi:hypothetical protein
MPQKTNQAAKRESIFYHLTRKLVRPLSYQDGYNSNLLPGRQSPKEVRSECTVAARSS